MNKYRSLVLNNIPFNGKSVVYVMSRDQRSEDNHALLQAQNESIQNKVPLYVLFILRKIPMRSQEHYKFMLNGLSVTSKSLEDYNIPLVIRCGNPEINILEFLNEVKAGAVYFDFSPLNRVKLVAKNVAGEFNNRTVVVDTHNIIPTWLASDKQEFAAHTFRFKVHKHINDFLVEPGKLKVQEKPELIPKSISQREVDAFLKLIPSSGIKIKYLPGSVEAKKQLKSFIKNNLNSYALNRNKIENDYQSGFSPYLHFGHISSLRISLELIKATNSTPLLIQEAKLAQHSDHSNKIEGMNSLLEEMVVRKELADNFCFYNENYRSFSSAPEWANNSLSEHIEDQREFIYSYNELRAAKTHDNIWNTAQKELTKTGKMHGYMRMYWAKKILEWTDNPETALDYTIKLNDTYSIDGGDPNGYVGILWSIAGLHDRPWFERPVFGKIRYMNYAGLKRKFDINSYIKRVENI